MKSITTIEPLVQQAQEWLQQQKPLHLAAYLIAIYLALSIVISAFNFAHRWIKVGFGTRNVPAAPGSNWLLGHALQLATTCAWEKMHEWVRNAPPMVRFRILHRTGIIINDPLVIKRIFQTRFKLYDKDLDFSYQPFLSILGTGLVTANGDHWQKQRILMAPALRIDMLDAILPIAKRAIERMATKIEPFRGTGQPVDIQSEFHLLTLQIIGEAILSLPPEECDRVFPSLYIPVMEESNHRVLAPWRRLYPSTVWQYNSRVKKLNNYIINILRERRAARGRGEQPKGDILDRVMTFVEERGEPWGPGVEEQLCYEVKTFLLAGHETSAAMLTWSVFELSQNEEALAAVRKEAAAALNREVPQRVDVEGMDWTLSCLKESLRKYSVVPVVTRNMNRDDEIVPGITLPAGSWIICHLQAVHHQYMNPMTWDPHRFLPGGEYEQFPDDIRPYMFLPFIQGPRNCLGQYFALMESRVLLGALSEKFTFTPVDPVSQGKTHPTVIPILPYNHMMMYVD